MKIKSNRNLILIAVAIAVVVIIAIWTLIAVLSSNSNSSTKVVTKEIVTIEKIEHSVSGNDYEDDIKEVLNKTVEIFKESVKLADGDFAQLAKSIEDGDLSSLPKSFKEKFYFAGELEKVNNQVIAFESIFALAANISIINEDFKLVEMADQSVFLAPEIGLASVPISVFTGTNNGFFLEFVWVDDEWKVNPYPTIQSSVLAATLYEVEMNQAQQDS